MELISILSAGVLLCIVALHHWYNQWCDRNGVPRPGTSSSGDFGSGCGGGDGGGD